jgi:hypothetical protein
MVCALRRRPTYASTDVKQPFAGHEPCKSMRHVSCNVSQMPSQLVRRISLFQHVVISLYTYTTFHRKLRIIRQLSRRSLPLLKASLPSPSPICRDSPNRSSVPYITYIFDRVNDHHLRSDSSYSSLLIVVRRRKSVSLSIVCLASARNLWGRACWVVFDASNSSV